MSGGCAQVLPLLVSTILLVLILTTTQAVPEPIDCRRMVFAPKCRGIAAKRAFQSLNAPGYILDTDRKMEGLEDVLGLYVTPQPLAVPQQGETRSQQARGYPARSTWNNAAEQQGLKTDILYDWYLSNKKRTREADMAYDY
ncbi:hypothetical protein L9F63_027580 [Diploptera punctata]|uniref:Elevenin n=1 Tax=Diploptera punctata TaxID=6984 RepID=A0AAD8A7V1_DIPPU|nr:hypothetical protein L9F63_027580 [Diploptera punctata]